MSEPITPNPQTKVNPHAETIKLPSLGKLYPKSHPLFGRESIQIKPMTTYEEDILTSKNLVKRGEVVKTLIQSCMLDKGINPDDMYIFDRNTILIAIRSISYGADYGVKVKCSNCDTKFNYIFDLSKLPITYLEDIPEPSEQHAVFKYTLPKSKEEIHFRFLTAQDEREMLEQSQASNKLQIGSGITNQISMRWIKSIVNFDGTKEKSEIASKVRNMLAIDSRALSKYVESISPTIAMSVQAICPNPDCGEEFELPMPIEKEFFWPDA